MKDERAAFIHQTIAADDHHRSCSSIPAGSSNVEADIADHSGKHRHQSLAGPFFAVSDVSFRYRDRKTDHISDPGTTGDHD